MLLHFLTFKKNSYLVDWLRVIVDLFSSLVAFESMILDKTGYRLDPHYESQHSFL